MDKKNSRKFATFWVIGALVCLVGLGSAVAASAWAPGVLYKVGAQVTYNNLDYQCIQQHTSAVGWEPPNVPALWVRPQPDDCFPWQTQTAYAVGAIAEFEGVKYRCIQAHTSQATWTPPATPALWVEDSEATCTLEARFCCKSFSGKKGTNCQEVPDTSASNGACKLGTQQVVVVCSQFSLNLATEELTCM